MKMPSAFRITRIGFILVLVGAGIAPSHHAQAEDTKPIAANQSPPSNSANEATPPSSTAAASAPPEQAQEVALLSERGFPIVGAQKTTSGEWIYPAPDCQGGKGTVPIPTWLTRVTFYAALCVHGLKKKKLTVEIGTNLMSYADKDNGDAARKYQVYYSLQRIEIAPNAKQVVWAMCGGGGEWLDNGSRVMPGTRLPKHITDKLEQQLDIIQRIEEEWTGNKNLLRTLEKIENNKTSQNSLFLRSKIKELDMALTDTAGLLRDTLINENRILLKQSNAMANISKPTQPYPVPRTDPNPAPTVGTRKKTQKEWLDDKP